jgi:hypothetical protein
MSQQERKALEGEVVRRLTMGAGAAALGLAWYFTASAATAVPIVFGAQPVGEGNEPTSWAEQLDDRVFIRTVHVPSAIRGPASGVKSGMASASSSAGSLGAPAAQGQAVAAVRSSGGQASAPGQSTGSAPVTTQPQPAAAPPPPPAPAPTPTATTGGSTPPK